VSKSASTRLAECLATIRQEGGAIDIEHIEAMARDQIHEICTNISLSHDLSWTQRKWPGAIERKLVRAIMLVEGCRARSAAVSRQRKIALCATDETQLRGILRHMLGPTHEDPAGPLYVAQGAGHGLPTVVPANWNQDDAEGGYFHYACHLDRQVICLGPENPRSKACGQHFPTYTASHHGKRAYELNRHFQIGHPTTHVIAGGGSAPRFVAGFVKNYSPLTFNDESGHFFNNFTAHPDNEKTFVAIIQALNVNARFVHYGKCPSGKMTCPGHSNPDTYPD